MLQRTNPMRLPTFERFPTITATYVAAAFVFGNTVLPLTGGAIKPYEIREFASAVSAVMNGETTTASLEPAIYPERGGVQLFPENVTPTGPEGYQYASASVSEEPQAAIELASLEMLPPLDVAEITPAMQTFDEEEAICIGVCGDEEPLEALPEEEIVVEDVTAIEPKQITLTPS
jgi:hypothetical protein